ncbi:MAG: tRNA preQ1(34) S-adenosylmethionine ribosyltransferase-isomerase QueA [Nitrospinota bacterium]
MKRQEYSFSLPDKLIAQYPNKERDQSRLMVVHRNTGRIEHRVFSDITQYLGENDALVFNNSRVFPARVIGEKTTGGKVGLLLLRETGPLSWDALVKGAKVRPGTELLLPGEGRCVIQKKKSSGCVSLSLDLPVDFRSWIQLHGKTPLPPYIRRSDIRQVDRERYQTVYAEKDGSVAAPTAGLHFTQTLKSRIKDKGVEMAYVTLHVGPGTFRPVTCEKIEDHVMDPEFFEISVENQEKISRFLKKKRRVIGVGSTSVRTLESALGNNGDLKRVQGSTDLFINEGYKFKGVGGMVTNFHLPESTLFILVCTFAGIDLMKECYNEAIKEE